MSTNPPYKNTKIAIYLREQIEALEGIKSQREIALECGYDKPNILSMFKCGEMKIPLDQIPPLAKALNADPRLLVGLGLEQYFDENSVIVSMFRNTVSDNETAIVNLIREVTGGTDPSLSPVLSEALCEAFAKPRAIRSAITRASSRDQRSGIAVCRASSAK